MPMDSIRIILASPSDLSEERTFISNKIDHWDKRLKRNNITIDLRRWEDTIPGSNPKGSQGIIDDDLKVENSDIFICMFGSKAGTIIESIGMTGTEHELNMAIQSFKNNGKPDIIFLTKQEYHLIQDEDYRKIESIKQEVGNIALYDTFTSLNELNDIIDDIVWKGVQKSGLFINNTPEKEDNIFIEAQNELQLLNAVGPQQSVVLHNSFYDLLLNTKAESRYVQFDEVFDGYELTISGVSDFNIIGECSKIIATPRYATVLTFKNCENITLSNLSIGHTPHKGDCVGAVLKFEDCNNITLNNLELFGCGTYGLELFNTNNVYLNGSRIYDCTYGALFLDDSDLTIENTTICDCINIVGSLFELESSYIYMNNVLISNNDTDNSMFSLSNSNIYGDAIDVIGNKYSNLGYEIKGMNLYNNLQKA